MSHFDVIIERARQMELGDPGDPRWSRARLALLPTAADCTAFVEWAREHPTWLHNVADVTDRVCAKPAEAAIAVLADIVAELLEESGSSRE